MPCLACALVDDPSGVPGGRIATTRAWVVEHCVGPLGVGTVIVKPARHVTHLADLEADEAIELGLLLKAVPAAVARWAGHESDPSAQVYACLWSHAGREPGHVHFVIQPVDTPAMKTLGAHGPALQVQLFERGASPDPKAAAAAATSIRAELVPRLHGLGIAAG
jgi:diadenosine tetraphosphate (Ap4A) HIT family hydrolase